MAADGSVTIKLPASVALDVGNRLSGVVGESTLPKSEQNALQFLTTDLCRKLDKHYGKEWPEARSLDALNDTKEEPEHGKRRHHIIGD